MSGLDRQRILEALAEMDRRLAERGIQAEVCLFGGAAMILAFQIQPKTQFFVEAVMEEQQGENA